MNVRNDSWKTDKPGPDENDGPSKTQRKRDMHDLQDLGKAITELSLERLAKIPMSERLLDAFREMHRITKGEARRRQLQYIGKLMREEDPKPLRDALAAINGQSRSENARLHRIERLRERLLEDESVLTEIGNAHPAADLSRLRQMRRNAIKEHADNRPPRSFRELFQMLRDIDAMPGPGHAVDNHGDDDEQDEQG